MAVPYPHDVAALVLLALGAFSLASLLQRRLFPRSSHGFLGCYAALLAGVVLWGLVVLPAPEWGIASSPWAWALVLVGGPLGGLLARRLDVRIVRALPTLGRTRERRPRRTMPRGTLPGPDPEPAPLARGAPGAALVLLVGGLEEVVHRGLLVDLALGLPSRVLVVLALVVNPLYFGLTHLQLDWRAAVSKLPLGVVALGLALACGSPLPAVLAHVTFNAGVVRDAGRTPVRVPTRRPAPIGGVPR